MRPAAALLAVALRPLLSRAANLWRTRCSQCRDQATPVQWRSHALCGRRAAAVMAFSFNVVAAVRTPSCRAMRTWRPRQRRPRAVHGCAALISAEVPAGSRASAVDDVEDPGVTMSSPPSPNAFDCDSTEPSRTSSYETGCLPSDWEWKLVFGVRSAALADEAEPSDAKVAAALAAAESATSKRRRQSTNETLAADTGSADAAASRDARKGAARERLWMRRRKAAATQRDACVRPTPVAATEATEATSATSTDGGESERRFFTIGLAAACALRYPSGTEASKAAHGA